MLAHNYFITKYNLSPDQHISNNLPIKTYESLSKLIFDSFFRSINEVCYMQPSIVYLLTSETIGLASAAITYSLPVFIPKESIPASKTCYLFNVCTGPEFRGKRIMEKLLVYMFKDLSNKQPLTLLLMVDPDNLSAKKLYHRLGFRIINKIYGMITTNKGYAELLSFTFVPHDKI